MTVVIDMIGVGIIVPTLPDVMKRFISDPQEQSQYFGYFVSVFAVMQFLAAPLLGALSDLFGRRPVLFISIFVSILDYMLMAFAPTLPLLFLGRILAGLSAANMTVAMAYITDISNSENRAANFGLVGAAFGIGFILGPVLGGIVGEYGPQYPFILAAGFNVLNLLFGLLVLPESLPKENRRKLELKRLNPLVSLKRVYASSIGALIFIYFLTQLAGLTHPSIWTLYTRYRFSWTPSEVGWSLAAVGLLAGIAQGGLTRVFIPRLGERKTVFIGILGNSVLYFFFGLATQGWMMYLALVVQSVFWASAPALQSLISKSAPSNEQGELQGSLVSIASLASIINPIVTTQLFSYFTMTERQLPGAPYFFASTVCFVAFILLTAISLNKQQLVQTK